MAGILDRSRRLVRDGRPVATGFVAVGDAAFCTNPSEGKGLSVGLLHAQLLRDVVRDSLTDPGALPYAFDLTTERSVAPFYRDQTANDRVRVAEMGALRQGAPLPTPDLTTTRLESAAMRDADLFRALVEIRACLAPPRDVLPARRARQARCCRRPTAGSATRTGPPAAAPSAGRVTPPPPSPSGTRRSEPGADLPDPPSPG